MQFTNSVGMTLRLVPPGRFLMGSPSGEQDRPDDETQHEVEITTPFYLGACEVTQGEYETVMGNNPSAFTKERLGNLLAGVDTSKLPVERVSWYGATDFCRKLSSRPAERRAGRAYRLPTEAEWEYASRGGARVSAPFNVRGKPVWELTFRDANFDGRDPYGNAPKGPGLGRPAAVGSYEPNGFGLCDMHGNVFEWCSDAYRRHYYKESPRKDPQGPAGKKDRVVARGGSYRDSGAICRSAYRYSERPDKSSFDIGFRVLCECSPGVRR
jgi:formylglycine-generating enzyme required for sulfatase activity